MPVQFDTRAIDTRICIYCSKRTAAADFSLEHLIPQFMGGNAACPDAATRDVCRRCNSLCGRFVDAPVARGFFQNSIDNGAWQHCIRFDAAAGNVFPLIYLGTCAEIAFNDNEESEVWLAPDGGAIWHIRARQTDDFATMAGGDPYLGRKDQSSRVYSFNASVHPYWINSNFKSVLAHFNDEPIFLGADTDIERQLTAKRTPGALCRKDESAIRERDHIQRLLDERRPVIHKVSMDILFDVRFLAKIALGFGYQALGSTYGELKCTDRLRKLLWTRRAALDAAQHEVRMAPYFASLQDKSHKMFALPVGFVFVLLALREGLVLKIIFPSGHDVQVSITDRHLIRKRQDS